MSVTIPNPLFPAHQRVAAEFQAYADVQIVATFGQPQAEYSAIHKSCGMMDLPQRGLIEITGKDRHSFLNNLLTNQTFDKQTKTPMPVGSGVYAFLLNAKTGRIIVDLNVLELGDRTLLEISARLSDTVLQTLDRYRFAEQVTLASRIDALHEIALHGPGAMEIIAHLLDPAPNLTAPISVAVAKMAGHDVTIFRDDACGVPSFGLIAAITAIEEIWQHLLTRFGVEEKLGKRALSPDRLGGVQRLPDRGRPADLWHRLRRFDSPRRDRPDATRRQPHQGVLSRSGDRRPHARAAARAKQLVGIRMDSDALPIAGSPILRRPGNAVGGITSSTISPILSNAALAMGFVRKPLFAVGYRLHHPRRRRNAAAPPSLKCRLL